MKHVEDSLVHTPCTSSPLSYSPSTPVTDRASLYAGQSQAKLRVTRGWRSLWQGDREEGSTTVEYAIGAVAAAGFAGLLLVILQSDTVRSALEGIIQQALTVS